MGMVRSGCFLFAVVVAIGSTPALAKPPRAAGPTDDGLLLVQSELDLLPAAKRLVTLRIEKAQPAAVVEMLRKESGLTIEIEGALPARPVLSASFRDTEVKDVLRWFAKQLPVDFRAEPPNRLWIIVAARNERPHASEAR